MGFIANYKKAYAEETRKNKWKKEIELALPLHVQSCEKLQHDVVYEGFINSHNQTIAENKAVLAKTDDKDEKNKLERELAIEEAKLKVTQKYLKAYLKKNPVK